MDTMYEQAARCPSCEVAGKLVNKRRATSPDALPGTMIHLFQCHNDRCPDFTPQESLPNGDTIPPTRGRWFVQVSPDGTVPPKGSGAIGPKAFEQANPHSDLAGRARDNLRFLAAADEGGAGKTHEIGNDLRYRGGY